MDYLNVIPQGSTDLRKRLPRGAIKALAEKYDYSWMWVHSLVTGKRKGDPRIIADAVLMAEIEDKRREAIQKVIQSDNSLIPESGQ